MSCCVRFRYKWFKDFVLKLNYKKTKDKIKLFDFDRFSINFNIKLMFVGVHVTNGWK